MLVKIAVNLTEVQTEFVPNKFFKPYGYNLLGKIFLKCKVEA
jgi:hypothetical protein